MTRSEFCEAVAKSLRDFGYPDATRAMIDDCLTAWLADRDGTLPHGVIGMFAQSQFKEAESNGFILGDLK